MYQKCPCLLYSCPCRRNFLESKSAEQGQWLSRLEQEHDNLRAAFNWLIEREESEKALRLGCALHWFWEMHGDLSEGRQWLEKALGINHRASEPMRARALSIAGELAYMQGAYDRTEVHCRDSILLFQELGDRHGIAINLNILGFMERSRGRYEAANALREESLVLFGELEDQEGIIHSLIFEEAFSHIKASMLELVCWLRRVWQKPGSGDTNMSLAMRSTLQRLLPFFRASMRAHEA